MREAETHASPQWLFESFVAGTIRAHFYVTESGVHKNRLFYFRKPIWRQLRALALDAAKLKTFRSVPEAEAREILAHGELGYSKLRLLPKPKTMRYIVNMGRKQTLGSLKEKSNWLVKALKSFREREKEGGREGGGLLLISRKHPRSHSLSHTPMTQSRAGLSINQHLQNLFHVLTFERTRQPETMGASVFGMSDVYPKFKPFVLLMRGSARDGPVQTSAPVYFVSVDVKNCFDTIRQQKLYEVVQKTLHEDEYVVQRYADVHITNGKVAKRYQRSVFAREDLLPFSHLAQDLARKVVHHAVLVDNVVVHFEDRAKLLELLQEHIFRNLVRVNGTFHLQQEGIAQGSVLSTLLCR